MRASDTIACVSAILQEDARVLTVLLSGSFGRGTADNFSDIDLVAVAARDDHEAVASAFQTELARKLPLVSWRQRAGDTVLMNAITDEWQRVDTLLIAPERLSAYAKDAVVPLFDREGLQGWLLPASPARQPDRARIEYIIDEFIRILGLLPVVIGREEYELGVTGAGLLRTHFIEMLIELSVSGEKGGALHLSGILSPAQRKALNGLPTPEPHRDSVIEAHLAVTRAFVPLARQAAAESGLPWPEDFEAATWRHLSRQLGVISPLGPR